MLTNTHRQSARALPHTQHTQKKLIHVKTRNDVSLTCSEVAEKVATRLHKAPLGGGGFWGGGPLFKKGVGALLG